RLSITAVGQRHIETDLGTSIDRVGVRSLGDRDGCGCRPAAGELEVADAGPPVEGPVVGVVLVRVPEGAVDGGVDGHIAVVAPAVAGIGLASFPGEERGLSLSER